MNIYKYRDEHPLHRTRDEMIEDLIHIYDGKSGLSEGSKNNLIESFLYEWTEYYGKFVGCKLWSKNALLHWEKIRKQKGNPYSQLRHEHIVPRKVIKNLISSNFSPDFNKMNELLNKYLIGVIVTTIEDKALLKDSMPHNWEINDEWARYKHKPIDLYYVKWEINNKKILTYSPTPFEMDNKKISYQVIYQSPTPQSSSKRYNRIEYNDKWNL
ncbi:hypothetical protein [Lysinibacillus capsici]|uniref:hypothetical protein n=1 Tax=Lysinibacillus capsici TaxID=2115968 RepID=UPI0034E478D3